MTRTGQLAIPAMASRRMALSAADRKILANRAELPVLDAVKVFI